MAIKDWVDTEAADPLILPINGHRYRIQEVGHLTGLRLQEEFARVQAGEQPTLTAEEFLQLTLGTDVYNQMRADDVPHKAIVHAATVAHMDSMAGREAAEQLWEHGPNPEALAAALMAASASSITSPSTPRPARTSSTKPRASTPHTKPHPPRKASKSTGRTSGRNRA